MYPHSSDAVHKIYYDYYIWRLVATYLSLQLTFARPVPLGRFDECFLLLRYTVIAVRDVCAAQLFISCYLSLAAVLTVVSCLLQGGLTALMWAADHNSVADCNNVLDTGADPNATNHVSSRH